MKALLEQFKHEQKLVSIRTAEQEWDTAHVGYINELDDEFVELTQIDTETKSDGSIFFKIEEIMELTVDDRYAKRLNFLNSSKVEIAGSAKPKRLSSNGKSLKDARISVLVKEKILSKIFCGDTYTIGYIIATSDSYITLACIGHEGDEDGTCYINKNGIDRLEFGDKELAKIEFYHKNRKAIYNY